MLAGHQGFGIHEHPITAAAALPASQPGPDARPRAGRGIPQHPGNGETFMRDVTTARRGRGWGAVLAMALLVLGGVGATSKAQYLARAWKPANRSA